MKLWNAIRWTGIIFLIIGLMFASSVFTALLYGKLTGELSRFSGGHVVLAEDLEEDGTPREEVLPEEPPMPSVLPPSREDTLPAPDWTPAARRMEKKDKVILDAPLLLQKPELPRGCEITSLTMLLQYYGYEVDKVELARQMPFDPTPIERGPDGKIRFWGDPQVGFVGSLTYPGDGIAIYHHGLFPLLQQYIPTAVDLTGVPFETIELQLSAGIPVVAWTTLYYHTDIKWVEWDSPTGPVKTTFQTHTVLIVGYDEDHVYLNDPINGIKAQKIGKDRFVETWEAMGRQALSYY